MDLDIMILNARHWKSKSDDKVYNTLDYIIVNKDNYIDNEKLKGYVPVTSWLKKNIVKEVKGLEVYKATFETQMSGLKSTLVLKKLTHKDGTIIDLS